MQTVKVYCSPLSSQRTMIFHGVPVSLCSGGEIPGFGTGTLKKEGGKRLNCGSELLSSELPRK